MADSDRARDAFEEHTPLDRARDALAGALPPRQWPEDNGPLFARAAQIAVVAQADAAHRIADALERIATALEGGPEIDYCSSCGAHADAAHRPGCRYA